jgi:hypothetical protein
MAKTEDVPGDSARKASPTREASIPQSRTLEPRPWPMRLLTALFERGEHDPPAVLAKQRFLLLDKTHACPVNPLRGNTTDWRAGCGKSARPVRREGRPKPMGLPYPITIFIAVIDDGHGQDDRLNLIIEVTGEKRKDKAAKVATARNLWVPAVNNDGTYGRWQFVEVADPWDAQSLIRSCIQTSQEVLP